MANRNNNLSPTAANIISSLGIKGATGKIPSGVEGSSFSGFIPVLNENGQLDLSFIPPGAAAVSVTRFHNVAIVDPGAVDDGSPRTGSVIAPFITIQEAAASFTADEGYDYAGRCAILLMPGKYDDWDIRFSAAPKEALIIGIGECILGSSAVLIDGLGGGITLSNIISNGTVNIVGASDILCLGRCYIKTLQASGSILKLSADSKVESTNIINISYISDAGHVGYTYNDQTGATETTVKDALDRIGGRRIRVINVTADSSGFDINNPPYVDVEPQQIGGRETYDLTEFGRVLIDGINRLVRIGKNPIFDTVNAGKVIADTIEAKTLKMDFLTLGNYKFGIDKYGYLIVADEGSSITPPKGVIFLEDTGDSQAGQLYVLGVSNGRMYIDKADDDSSSSHQSTQYVKITDAITGEEYEITMVNGRLMISGAGSGSGLESNLFVLDESTGLYHKIVAVTDPETHEVDLALEQQGVPPTELNIDIGD